MIHSYFSGFAADLLDEEADQTEDEIHMIKAMLQTMENGGNLATAPPLLDRPTHTGKIATRVVTSHDSSHYFHNCEMTRAHLK